MLSDFYGNETNDEYHGRITRSEKLLCCPYHSLGLKFEGYKLHQLTAFLIHLFSRRQKVVDMNRVIHKSRWQTCQSRRQM